MWSAYKVPGLVPGKIGGGYVISGDPGSWYVQGTGTSSPSNSSAGGTTRTSPVCRINTSLREVFAALYTKPIAGWYPDNNMTNGKTTTTSSDGNPSDFPIWADGLIGALLDLLVSHFICCLIYIASQVQDFPEREQASSRNVRYVERRGIDLMGRHLQFLYSQRHRIHTWAVYPES